MRILCTQAGRLEAQTGDHPRIRRRKCWLGGSVSLTAGVTSRRVNSCRSDWEDVDGTEDLLVSRLVAEVLLQLRRELQKPVPEVRFTLENGQLRKWLTMKFPGVSSACEV